MGNFDEHFHTANAILKAPVVPSPWEHTVVSEVFAPELYAKMRSNFPTIEEMRPLGKSTTRYIYWLRDKGSDFAVSPFWDWFRDAILPVIVSAVVTKFGYSNIVRTTGAELVLDLGGYRLGPHTDTPDRAITSVFYLPDPGMSPDPARGTSLYYNPIPDPAGKGHKLTADFKRVAVVPYAPNAGLIFPRTDLSYHGVEGGHSLVRWTLAVDVFRE